MGHLKKQTRPRSWLGMAFSVTRHCGSPYCSTTERRHPGVLGCPTDFSAATPPLSPPDPAPAEVRRRGCSVFSPPACDPARRPRGGSAGMRGPERPGEALPSPAVEPGALPAAGARRGVGEPAAAREPHAAGRQRRGYLTPGLSFLGQRITGGAGKGPPPTPSCSVCSAREDSQRRGAATPRRPRAWQPPPPAPAAAPQGSGARQRSPHAVKTVAVGV